MPVNRITTWIQTHQKSQVLPLTALFGLISILGVYGSVSGQAAWEVELMRSIQAASPAPLRWIAHAMTALGNWPIYPVAVIVPIVVLMAARHRSLALLVAAAAILRMSSPMLKAIVDRERPSAALVDVSNQLSSPAFPSGHVLSATLLFGVLVYAVEIAVPHPTVKRWLQGALVCMIVLMGYARVELGEHWPTDVMGGWAVGAVMLIFLCRAHRMFTAEPEPATLPDD
jgi:membrane-associated phospholipid phosphatase